LLDQSFPKPPGFSVSSVDASLEVQHLSDYRPDLSAKSTPDWMVYWIAHHGAFDAMVTRDAKQRTQSVEMYVLSRLAGFSVITWRTAIEDPVTEWGQLIAYLPELQKKFANDMSRARSGTIVLLPRPSLSADNLMDAGDQFGELANAQGISRAEAMRNSKAELRDIIEVSGLEEDDFADLLQ
jgi:hypothetical protein